MLIGIVLDLEINLGSVAILTILNHSVYKHECLSMYLDL